MAADRAATARQEKFLEHAAAANALVAQGQYAAAVPALKEAIALAPAKMSPELFTTYNNLGAAYSALGRIDDALKVLHAIQVRTLPVPETELARPEYRRERVRLATAMGNILLARGKLVEAEIVYRRAVTLGPEDAAAHGNLANVLFLQGKFAEADAQFDLAVARDPNNPETLNNWGIMLLNNKHPSEAEKKFRSALFLNPKSAKYWHGLGLALRAQGRYGPALQAQRTALVCDDKMMDALLELADLYAQLKDYKQAEIYLRGALDSKHGDPNNLQAILALARLLAGTNDPGQRNYLESATLLQQAVELTHQQDVNLLAQLADMYALAGFYDRARETISLALQRAGEQNLSPVDRELLLQRSMRYSDLQAPVTATGDASPLTTVGDPLGLNPQPDPYDPPKPAPKLPPIELVSPP